MKDLKSALDGLVPLTLTSEERLGLIGKFADSLKKFKDKYIALAAKEIDKPATESERERETALELLEKAKDLMFLQSGKKTGPILAILPFDTPLLSFTKLWLFALAQNRPLVLKPSTHSIQTTLELVKLLNMPENTLRVLELEGQQLEIELKENPVPTAYIAGWKTTVDRFTRATTEAKLESRLITEFHVSTIAVADKGSDIDQVVGETIENAFAFNGQYACSQKGLLVHASLFEELAEKLKERLNLYIAPYPAHEANSTVTDQVDKSDEMYVHTAISDSIAEGAEVLAGGSSPDKMFYPTIVTSLKPERKLVTEDFRAPYLWLEKYDEHPDEYLQAIKKEKRIIVYGQNTTLQSRLAATLNWEVQNRTEIEAVLPHQWPNPLNWLTKQLKGN